MPIETTASKNNSKTKNKPVIQMNHKQLEELIQKGITMAIKPLEDKITK